MQIKDSIMKLNRLLNGYYEVEYMIVDGAQIKHGGWFLEIVNGCVYQHTGSSAGVKAYQIMSEYSFKVDDWDDHPTTFVYDIKADKIVEKASSGTKYIWKKVHKEEQNKIERST